MDSKGELNGSRFLVTGASSGIGAAVAVRLSQHGASLVLTGRDEQRLDATLRQLTGGSHTAVTADLAVQRDLTSLMDAAVADGVKLSGFVHCAGIAPMIPAGSLTAAAAEKCMNVNFFALTELVRLISKKKYRAQSGSIVEISSVNSLFPDKCQTIYAASKAAANAAVKAYALELADKGFRINAVLPGAVDTPMTRDAFAIMGSENTDRKLRRQILGLTPPEQIADIVLFLLSPASSAITGQLIRADGGYINF